MRYGFLRQPRWIGLTVLMVLLAIACVVLGQWQMGRYEEKVAARDAQVAAWGIPAVPIDEIGHVGAGEEWRLVTATGTYRTDQVLLRGRSVDGHPAVHVLTLFDTSVESRPATIIVDRGWLPNEQVEGYGGDESLVPAPPTGEETTLLLRARAAEEPYDRVPPPGYTFTLNPAQVLAAMGDPEVGVLLDGRFEAQAGQLGSTAPGAPLPYPRPSANLGNHFAYAWEWRIFAVAALAVVPILARREARESSWIVDGVDVRALDLTDDELRDLGLDPARKAGEAAQRSPRWGRFSRSARPSDEEVEDAILDHIDQAREMSSR